MIYSHDRYQLRVIRPKRVAHRIRTCKPFQANCFQDSSLTTRTYGMCFFYILYKSVTYGNRTHIFRSTIWGTAFVRKPQWSQRDSNPAFPDWKPGELAIYSMGPCLLTDVGLEPDIWRLRVSDPNHLNESAIIPSEGIEPTNHGA